MRLYEDSIGWMITVFLGNIPGEFRHVLLPAHFSVYQLPKTNALLECTRITKLNQPFNRRTRVEHPSFCPSRSNILWPTTSNRQRNAQRINDSDAQLQLCSWWPESEFYVNTWSNLLGNNLLEKVTRARAHNVAYIIRRTLLRWDYHVWTE